MKQDTLLQGCQWIDILNIGRTSGHLGGDGVDIRLGEFHQGQHLWCDRLAFFRNQIVGRQPFQVLCLPQYLRQLTHTWCREYVADFSLQSMLPQPLHERHHQQ